MPRNVRNFWIELDVDGRGNMVKTGPRRKDGGFDCQFFIRDLGEVKRSIAVIGRVHGEKLMLKIVGIPGQDDVEVESTTR